VLLYKDYYYKEARIFNTSALNTLTYLSWVLALLSKKARRTN